LGRAAEITRDEVKFQKFVTRLRKKFSELFHDLLKTQLVLKGIISIEEWDDMSEHIQYDFIADNYFSELKDQEILNERLNLVTTMDPFAGRYFSLDYIRRKVLRQSDAEIKEIDKQMEKEISTGKLPDPAALDPMTGEPMEGAPMDAPPEEESEDITSTGPESVSPADYKRGEF
tara:strand:- start:3222 stop:3743 length:522 start_codon:yes stop_codon:yes gene_type:complete